MEIKEKKIGPIVQVTLSGRIDAYTSERLSEEIYSIINSGQSHFLVNFGDVSYISSAGLRVFLGAYKQLSESGGKIKLSELPDSILKVFALAGFDKVFDIYPSDKEAMEDFNIKGEQAA